MVIDKIFIEKRNEKVDLRYSYGTENFDSRLIKSTFEKYHILPNETVLNKIKLLGLYDEKFGGLYSYFNKIIQKKYELGIIHEDSRMVKFVFERSKVLPSKKGIEAIKSLSHQNEKFRRVLECFSSYVPENYFNLH